MKYFLISIQIIALILIFLELFEVINYKYISSICYTILGVSLILILIAKKRTPQK